MTRLRASADPLIVAAALGGILTHFIVQSRWPLVAVLVIGGVPLVLRLLWKGAHGEFGSDQLAGISIVASVLLDEYLAGAIVVLMLSGGETLEAFAVTKATSVLRGARRPPAVIGSPPDRRRRRGRPGEPSGRGRRGLDSSS